MSVRRASHTPCMNAAATKLRDDIVQRPLVALTGVTGVQAKQSGFSVQRLAVTVIRTYAFSPKNALRRSQCQCAVSRAFAFI